MNKPRPSNPTPISSPQRQERVRTEGLGKIELDWKAYFYQFCRVHGPQEPVEHGGRLLFKDGWTYSSIAYEGPEWPPPSDFDELDILVARYWIIRRGILEIMADTLVRQLSKLTEIAAAKSLPLQQVVVSHDDKGNRLRGYRALNVQGLEYRLSCVREDLRECDVRLKEIAAETVARRERSTKCQRV